jgi:hypothetical protein
MNDHCFIGLDLRTSRQVHVLFLNQALFVYDMRRKLFLRQSHELLHSFSLYYVDDKYRRGLKADGDFRIT